jgi:hypothetical protein
VNKTKKYMSENIPQSNPENNEHKMYLIPRGDGSYDLGYITGNKEEYSELRQRNGSTETIKRVEVQLVDADGKLLPLKMMIAEYTLGETMQDELMQKQLRNPTNLEGYDE